MCVSMYGVPSPLTPSDPPRCDRPIRQILKILFNSPDRVLCFRADRAFVGQGAASGAVRPAPASMLWRALNARNRTSRCNQFPL